jgi:PPP family 3-phenylpropionic acid transporter
VRIVRRQQTRPAVAVHGLFVVFGLVIAAFFPFLAIYLNARGIEAGEIGLVILVMAIGRSIFLPIWGHVADTTFGRVAVLRWGAIGTAIAAFSMNVVHGVWGIAAVAFVASAFMVAIGPNIDAIALTHLGEERMSDYGRIRAWESLSYAAACLLFGSILQAVGVELAMPFFAIASVAVLVWSTFLPPDRPAQVTRHGRMGAVGAVFREAPRFWGFLAAVFLLWTGFNAAWNFFSLKIEDAGGGPFLVGVGTALGGMIEVPVMRFSSRLQRRWGLRRVYVLGCGVYALGFLAWGVAESPTVLAVLTGLEGVAFALIFTSTVVVVGKLLPASLYSTGNSVVALVGFGIGPVLGAGVGGFAYQYLGSTVTFTGAAVLAVLAAGVAWIALSPPALSQPGDLPAIRPPGIEPEPGIVP